ncbi:MAG: EamA family transporter RarD [Halarsenatibacteraceae bacterium]
MENQSNSKNTYNQKLGVIYGVLAFTAWGLLPIYWKLLNQVPALEILAHRIVWSFVFVTALLIVKSDFQTLKVILASRRKTLLIMAGAVLISINWFTYIWAVNANFVLQTSMGYYINPLVVSILSMIVLKEKFNKGKILALVLATIGVLILTIQYGEVPWVALILAISFALYGLVKKILNLDAITSLALETLMITPIAIFYIGRIQLIGTGSFFSISIPVMFFLIFSGIVTATPLLWFAKGTQLVEFSTIGFLQYIAPTISFFLGVFLFNEEFSTAHLISFSFIWVALIIYTIAITRGNRSGKKETHDSV